MLEGGGFEVIDLGADVSPEKFVAAVNEKGANVVCLSALLTVTMPARVSHSISPVNAVPPAQARTVAASNDSPSGSRTRFRAGIAR